jgi:hypothetical protein
MQFMVLSIFSTIFRTDKTKMNLKLLARMAELVDALVSKTSSFWSAGSTPAPGTAFFPSTFSHPYNWHQFFFELPKFLSNLVLREKRFLTNLK